MRKVLFRILLKMASKADQLYLGSYFFEKIFALRCGLERLQLLTLPHSRQTVGISTLVPLFEGDSS